MEGREVSPVVDYPIMRARRKRKFAEEHADAAHDLLSGPQVYEVHIEKAKAHAMTALALLQVADRLERDHELEFGKSR